METRQTLVCLQVLRAVAALMVVFHHTVQARSYRASPLPESDFGRLGVLIFFVLSGFIMVHACRRESAGVFLRRRFIRVAPLYWIVTGLYFLVLLRGDIAVGEPLRRAGEFLASLAFIPHWHSMTTTQVWPVLVQGWTLNFEMFFYLLFALGLMLGRPAQVTMLLLAALVLAGALLRPQDAVLMTWTSPLMLLFLAGLGLGVLREKLSFAPLWPVLPLAAALIVVLGLGVIPAGVAGSTGGWPPLQDADWTALAYLAAVGTVAGTIALDDRRRSGAKVPKLALLLGDASYAIYLTHTLVLIVALPALLALPLTGPLQFAVVVLGGLCLSAAGGTAVHWLVERPLTGWLRRRLGGSPARPQPGLAVASPAIPRLDTPA